MTEALQLATRDEARSAKAAPGALPGFERDSHGKPESHSPPKTCTPSAT